MKIVATVRKTLSPINTEKGVRERIAAAKEKIRRCKVRLANKKKMSPAVKKKLLNSMTFQARRITNLSKRIATLKRKGAKK